MTRKLALKQCVSHKEASSQTLFVTQVTITKMKRVHNSKQLLATGKLLCCGIALTYVVSAKQVMSYFKILSD